MLTKKDKLRALKEAWTDTLFGSVINVPLNYLMLLIAFHYELTAFTTTIFMTVVFTFIAITRKYYIRTRFEKHYRKSGI